MVMICESTSKFQTMVLFLNHHLLGHVENISWKQKPVPLWLKMQGDGMMSPEGKLMMHVGLPPPLTAFSASKKTVLKKSRFDKDVSFVNLFFIWRLTFIYHFFILVLSFLFVHAMFCYQMMSMITIQANLINEYSEIYPIKQKILSDCASASF
jgi:hypothetical protein